MPIKRYKPDQIVTLLRQIEVEIANGKTTSQAWKPGAGPLARIGCNGSGGARG